MKIFNFELGEQVKDIITEFVGTIVSRMQNYPGDNIEYGILGKVKNNVVPSMEWISEERLVIDNKEKKVGFTQNEKNNS